MCSRSAAARCPTDEREMPTSWPRSSTGRATSRSMKRERESRSPNVGRAAIRSNSSWPPND